MPAVASQSGGSASRDPHRRPRIAVLTHSYYEEDPRVRREAEALVAAGSAVDVFALRRPGTAASEIIDGVAVRRLGVRRHQGAGLPTYLTEYLALFVRATIALVRAHLRDRYHLVHVHTLPDFLVFAALPLKLRGVPVILDLHEAMPEFFGSRFRGRAGRVGRAVVAFQERAAIAFASAIVTVNPALGDRLLRLGVPAGKLTIIRNLPALARFDPASESDRPFMADDTLRLVYAGALSPIYELDVVLDAMAIIDERRPTLPTTLDLFGRDFEEVPLRGQVTRLGLGDRVRFHGRIPIDAVPAAIAAGDLGLAPTRRTEFTDYSLSTKIFEYAAMRRPVVASSLPEVSSTFGDDVVTYAPGDADDLARAILRVVDDAADREGRVARAFDRVRASSWESESAILLGLVDRLTSRSGGPS